MNESTSKAAVGRGKKRKTTGKDDVGMKITIQERGEAPVKRFKFGSVMITALAPTETEILRNIKLGQEALERGAKALTRRGVRIKRQKDVPLYSADPRDPSLLVRILNGKKTRGRFIDGQFVEIDLISASDPTPEFHPQRNGWTGSARTGNPRNADGIY